MPGQHDQRVFVVDHFAQAGTEEIRGHASLNPWVFRGFKKDIRIASRHYTLMPLMCNGLFVLQDRRITVSR